MITELAQETNEFSELASVAILYATSKVKIHYPSFQLTGTLTML